METETRRPGIRLARDRFDYELSRRGLSAREFAKRTGIHEVVLSRARRGYITGATLRRLTDGLLSIPLMPGADMLVAEPESKVST